MLIHNADITGSLLVNGTGYNTGSFSGSFIGAVAGTTATASYVEYNNVANKPALVSGSSQITYSGLTGIPADILSGSNYVDRSTTQIISGSKIFADQIIVNDSVTFSGGPSTPYSVGITGDMLQFGNYFLTGSISLTGNIDGVNIPELKSDFDDLNNKTLVSSSAQIAGYNIFATTGSNQFNGSQAITGSLTVTGQVVAQTLNVQQVTSSIVYSSGSNIFGNSVSNTQQFTGSVGVTGSLTVNGASTFSSTGTFSGIVGVGGLTEEGWALKSNGNLKIESNTGTTVLQVNDTATGGKIWSLISSGNGNVHSISAGTFYLRNSSDSLTALSVTSGGNVGVGTASPGYRLDTLFSNTTDADIFRAGMIGVSNGFTVQRVSSNFRYIFTDGNVGIGTTSPGATLDVNGSIYVSGEVSGRSFPFNTTIGAGADATTTTIRAGSTNGFQSAIFLEGGNVSNTIKFNTASSERMRITSAGRLLIGKTNDEGFTLDVNGSFRTGANGIALDSSGFAVSPNANTPWNAFRYSHPQNIVPNGDLESWTSGTSTAPDGFGGYDLGGSTIITRESSIIKEGLYSAKIANPTGASFSGMSYDGVRVDKTPSSSGSSTYTISFWYLTPNTNGSTSYIGIYDTAANSYSVIESLPKAGVWVFYSRTFSIRDDSNWGINWWVSWGAGTANDVLYVDSISLNKGNQIYNTTRSSVSTTGNVTRWGDFYNLGGNVGIGTTSPNCILDLGLSNLNNGTNNQFLRVNAGGYNQASSASLDLFNWSNNFGQPLGWRLTSTTEGVGVSVGRALTFNTVVTDGGGGISTATERMRITSGGNVGIGTSPSYRLDVRQITTDLIAFFGFSQTSSSSNGLIKLNSGRIPQGGADFTGESGIIFGHSGGTMGVNFDGQGGYIKSIRLNTYAASAQSDSALVFATAEDNVDYERMRITSTGRTLLLGSSSSPWEGSNRALLELNNTGSALLGLRINGSERAYFYHNNTHLYIENMLNPGSIYVISVSGGVYLTAGGTSWTSNSDERLKNINGEIENAVDKLNQLRAVNFSWKNNAVEKQNLGLIAQDVEKVFPELIDKNKLPSKANEAQQDETEYLGVRYQELIPVLVKAIQELKSELDAAKTEIQTLKQQ